MSFCCEIRPFLAVFLQQVFKLYAVFAAIQFLFVAFLVFPTKKYFFVLH